MEVVTAREQLLESMLVRLDVEGVRVVYVYDEDCADMARTLCSDGEMMGGVMM